MILPFLSIYWGQVFGQKLALAPLPLIGKKASQLQVMVLISKPCAESGPRQKITPLLKKSEVLNSPYYNLPPGIS